MTEQTQFSATGSLIGYLYQVRLGLLLSLHKLRKDTGFAVSLETLDDISFQDLQGSPKDLLQTKHHLKKAGSLSDASVDLWKTIRVWFETYPEYAFSKETVRYLITTASAPAGSAASFLKQNNRNVTEAIRLLKVAANSSQNVQNTRAYTVFLESGDDIQKEILSKVFILDGSAQIDDLADQIKEEAMWASERPHHLAFQERLEGWWFRRVIGELLSASKQGILAAEIEAQMNDLREQFRQDSLPIDEDILAFSLDEVTLENHREYAFVKQLDIVGAGKRRVAAAIRDYLRAFAQRSNWLRDELVIVGDLSKYERKLTEEWELVFARMLDEIEPTAAEEEKKRAAREVLKWAETALIPIRQNVTEPFVCRGSLHMLSNGGRIGWHPEFKQRLESILQGNS